MNKKRILHYIRQDATVNIPYIIVRNGDNGKEDFDININVSEVEGLRLRLKEIYKESNIHLVFRECIIPK